MNEISSREESKIYGSDNRELVVEDNTIYEIDFECIHCMESKNEKTGK